MKFKKEHMRNEFWKLHVKLQYLVFDIAVFCICGSGYDFFIELLRSLFHRCCGGTYFNCRLRL